MTWTIKFTQDTEQEGLGSLVASIDDFYYSNRVDTNNNDEIDEFIATAKSMYSNTLSVKASIKVIEDRITQKINI